MFISLLFRCLLFLILPEVALAGMVPLEGGVILGPMVGHVELESRTIYETNVFRTAVTPMADVISITKPGVNLEVSRERISIAMDGYYLDYRPWGISNRQTTQQAAQSWSVGGTYTQQFFSGTSLSLQGRHTEASDPILADLTLSSDRINRRTPRIGTQLRQETGTGTIVFLVDYLFSRDIFEPDFSILNRNQHHLKFNTELRLFTTLSVGTTVKYLRLVRANSSPAVALANDQDTIVIQGMVKGAPSPLYTVDVNLGMSYSLASGQSKTARPVVAASILFHITELTDLRLQYQYENVNGVSNDELVFNKGLLHISHKFTESLLGSVTGTGWQTQYFPRNPVNRKDIDWKAIGKLEYIPSRLSFMRVAAEYNYLTRRVNDAQFNFEDHLVQLVLNLRY